MPSRVRELTTAALVAALMAAASWAGVYIYQVPFTLQTLFVALAALLLRPTWAAGAMLTYLLLGAVGLPVFAGGKAGIGVLFGPTGGYLLAFVVAALLGSTLRRAIEEFVFRAQITAPNTVGARRMQLVADVVAVLATVAVVALAGSVWLAASAGITVTQALAVGAAPFVLADLAKGATAGILAWTVRRAVRAGRS